MKATSKITISRSKWEALGEAERALALKMGIKPEGGEASTLRAPRQPKVCELKPYVLGLIIDCQLCKETHIDLYNMVKCKGNGGSYLEARRTTEPECSPDRWSVRKVSSCKNCRIHLRQWPKQDLIDKVLEQAICTKLFVSKPIERKNENNGNYLP